MGKVIQLNDYSRNDKQRINQGSSVEKWAAQMHMKRLASMVRNSLPGPEPALTSSCLRRSEI